MRRAFTRAGCLACAAALALPSARAAAREPVDMTIEELNHVVVTSVSRNPEPLSRSPAAIFVITTDDIRRSGATTLPEALRLAPNLEVARIDSGSYAISARGFNSMISNKLLVLIDGRTVYSPLFSGVFWEAQDVMLEDVERIEVISGPAPAAWGVNAVNGVINVITRPAAATQGTLVAAGGGNREAGIAARQGWRLDNDGHLRIYGKASSLEDTQLENGSDAGDQWDRGQLGFRADWERPDGGFTLQGDAYMGNTENRPVFGAVDTSGANLLTRWRQVRSDGSTLEVQGYYDQATRDDDLLLNEESEIFDVQLRHAIPWGLHRVTWGAGYRHADDESEPGQLFAFVPASQSLNWLNVFGQLEAQLTEKLGVTLGLRFERNDYTGWETLPNVRLAYRVTPAHMLWGAVSRPVRSPARLDREIVQPPQPPFFIGGGPNFEAETATVYQVGYRGQPTAALSLSVTAFQHDYDNLRSAQAFPTSPNILIENGIEGEISGVEAWANLQVRPSWRLGAGGMLLHQDLRLKAGSNDPFGTSPLGNDPDYQLMLRSSHNITDRHQLDVIVRHVAELPEPLVPAYTALDARFGWQVTPDMELSLVGQNLLDEQHPEFGQSASRSEIERAVYLKLVVRK